MSKVRTDEEGVNALKSLAAALPEAVELTKSASDSLKSAFDEKKEVLGPHTAQIEQILEQVEAARNTGGRSTVVIQVNLIKAAARLTAIIQNGFADGGASGASSASFSSPSSPAPAGGFPGGGGWGQSTGASTNSGGKTFGSFETGTYKNGEAVIKGDRFEQYLSDYYDSENSTYESLGEHAVIETIAPSSIEGIHLGSTEMENNGQFWSQHESGGTEASFLEIASHIPEVKSQLEAGKSLSEIRSDPSLEKCVSIYFDPANIPRVVKNDGYYEFDSNGRHRILAARELGYEIPVKVVGIRRRR